MVTSLGLLIGAAIAVIRLANPPEIVVKDGLMLPCTVNDVCVPDAGMLANHLAVIAFATVTVAWVAHRVERSSGRADGRSAPRQRMRDTDA